MCGIVGYVGPRQSAEFLLSGLKSLEYRGYDSAGLAIYDGQQTQTLRSVGKLIHLSRMLAEQPLFGSLGIGHTRWATHGRPSEINAHPHRAGSVHVVHNGILENHLELRAELEARGHLFQSETDTEIFSHFIREKIEAGSPLVEAVRAVLAEVRGSYALLVLSETEPDKLVVAKNASPMVIGLGEGEMFLASDIPALINYTRQMIFLHEGDLAVVTCDRVEISVDGEPVERPIKRISWTPGQAEKGGYKHFMLKEIHEQPRALADTLRGRISLELGDVHLENVQLTEAEIQGFDRITLCACGTAWHAALLGKVLIEEATRIPVEVDLGSEFRYRDPIIDEYSLFIAVSQSGETADTLAALREAKGRGARILSICNSIESSIARASDDLIYTHAGPEIGVASTKAFLTQVTALQLLSLFLGRRRGRLSAEQIRERLQGLSQLPQQIEQVLKREPEIKLIAQRFMGARDFLYLGRGMNFPIALEGALKLKEISYIHAEGYAAGEMKHGPIALIDEEMPVVIIATQDQHYEKTLSNLEEVRAREGRIIALAQEGDEAILGVSDAQLWVLKIPKLLQPILNTVPLQLLAYHIADLKGTDIDQPRNLAKSVTVE